MDERWTQQGKMYLFTLAIMAVLSVIGLLVDGDAGTLRIVLFGLVAVILAAALSRLTVSIRSDDVHVAFGPGWPRRTVPFDEIRSVTTVRNRWYHGWGIRKVASGWMFNVWGLDAVELGLTSGRVFRIGSDRAEALAAAIEERRRSATHDRAS